jgi:hypothetical protein
MKFHEALAMGRKIRPTEESFRSIPTGKRPGNNFFLDPVQIGGMSIAEAIVHEWEIEPEPPRKMKIKADDHGYLDVQFLHNDGGWSRATNLKPGELVHFVEVKS